LIFFSLTSLVFYLTNAFLAFFSENTFMIEEEYGFCARSELILSTLTYPAAQSLSKLPGEVLDFMLQAELEGFN
jgi:hypothetical protein